MSGVSLDYTIEEKKKIVVEAGTLDTISQKNSEGFHVANISHTFDLNIKLKQPSIVYFIEVSSIFTPKIIFELFDLEGKSNESVIQSFEPNSVRLVEFPKSRNNKLLTSKIKLVVCNTGDLNSIIVGLKYLLVKGEKLQPSKASKRDISKKPEFTEARLSPHALPLKVKETGALFSERKKNKEKEKSQHDEDSINLRKAIQMSKKEAEKKESTSAIIKNEKGSVWMQPKEEKARQYDLVDFDKVKQFYTQVNSSWLEAQRKIEIQKGVKQNERLSKYITIKHLNGRNICVDLPQPKRDQIEAMAADLGAKIQKEVTDNCLLISTRKDTDKVSKARKCKNVKILNPKFIEQCKQYDALLNERDYFLQL